MVSRHFLKNMKSFFWRYKLVSALLLVSAVLIPILVHSQIDTPSAGYKLLKGEMTRRVYPAGYSAVCITSAVSSDHFISTKTKAEFDSFVAHTPAGLTIVPCPPVCGDAICNGTETCSTCPGDCGICSRYRPSGVYIGNVYETDRICGGGYPSCTFSANDGVNGSHTLQANQAGVTDIESGCALLSSMRYCQKITLVGATGYIYNGDPCTTGYRRGSAGVSWADCEGTYDYAANTCVYDHLHTRNSYGWGETVFTPANTSVPIPVTYNGTTYDLTGASTASWGYCSTHAPCGDGICASGYSESCSTCSADCGACPAYCGDYSCNGSEDCSSCPGDCGSCTDCGIVDCPMYNKQFMCDSDPCCMWVNSTCQSKSALQ